MTLVVEDGTGVVGANTYASEEHAGTYHGIRGTVDDWLRLIDLSAVEGMLIEATRKIDRTYTWLGKIATTTQGLALPRRLIFLDDGRQIDGVAQVALAADAVSWLAVRMFNDQSVGGERTVKSESLPDYSVVYADDSVNYGEVDAILATIVESGGLGGGMRSGKLVRWS